MQLDCGRRAGSSIRNYFINIIYSYKTVHDFHRRNHRKLKEMNYGGSEACAFEVAGRA
jgi:hypothetical protein